MNLIFLSMANITDVNNRGVAIDLIRKFRNEGHNVYIVSPRERRTGEKTHLYEMGGIHF